MLLKILKNIGNKGRLAEDAQAPVAVNPNNKIRIITPPHTVYLAHLVFKCFSSLGFEVSINIGEYAAEDRESYFVVLCPQVFKRLPDSFIAFQMEQAGTHWFDPGYLSILKNPRVRVLEYSSRNLPFLIEQGVPEQHIRTAQLTTFHEYDAFLRQHNYIPAEKPTKDFDVLFYGGINERRFKALSKIDHRFRTKVAVGIFGPPLYELILRSRTVVNIHIHDTSPLESTRIFEALSLETPVVSESSPDIDDYIALDKGIKFSPAGNTDALLQAIDATLQGQSPESGHPDWQSPSLAYGQFCQSLEWAAAELGWSNPVLNGLGAK
ncbi:MAG: glycosyltransferase [Azonexus sp.]